MKTETISAERRLGSSRTRRVGGGRAPTPRFCDQKIGAHSWSVRAGERRDRLAVSVRAVLARSGASHFGSADFCSPFTLTHRFAEWRKKYGPCRVSLWIITKVKSIRASEHLKELQSVESRVVRRTSELRRSGRFMRPYVMVGGVQHRPSKKSEMLTLRGAAGCDARRASRAAEIAAMRVRGDGMIDHSGALAAAIAPGSAISPFRHERAHAAAYVS